MQIFLFFWLSVVPAAAILWFARGFITRRRRPSFPKHISG